MRAALWIVPLLAIVAAGSIASGYAAEGWDEFDWRRFHWEVAAIVGTAFGTTLLALATLVLALGTRRLAHTAEAQVAVERDSLAAGFRPLLLNVPPGFGGTPGPLGAGGSFGVYHSIDPVDGGFRVSVPVRNAGLGVAFVTDVWVHWKEGRYEGRARNAIVPPGELTSLVVIVSDDEIVSPGEIRIFGVVVLYEDLGGNPWQSTVELKWRAAGGWMVSAVEVRSFGVPDDQAVKSGDMLEE